MMTRNPSLLPVLALAAGITLSKIGGTWWWAGMMPILGALILYFMILHRSGNPVSAFGAGKWHRVWVVLLFIGIGMLDESLSRPMRIEEAFGGRPQAVECVVEGVLSKTYGDRLDLTIQGTNGAKARLKTGVTTLSAGDIVEIPAKSLVDVYADTSETGRRLAPALAAKGIIYTGRIPSHKIIFKRHSGAIRHRLADMREKIETEIEKSSLGKPASDFLNAILMGDKTGLDQEVRITFANGGTAHMLALSGLHMGIIAGLLMFLMWPFRASGRYKWGYGVAIAVLWGYVMLSGMSASSVRACIMISFAYCAVIMERKNAIDAALTSACLLILLFSPGSLFDAGFQLSVVCVASLIAFASRLNPISHREHPALYRICEALLTTMVATAASWALISFYFGQIPLMFLPANVLLLPLLPAYLGAGAIYVTLLCAGIDAGMLASGLDSGYTFLLWATETLSGESEFVLNYQIHVWGVFIWMGLLAAAAIVLNRQKT